MLRKQRLVGVAIQFMAVLCAGSIACAHPLAANTHHAAPAAIETADSNAAHSYVAATAADRNSTENAAPAASPFPDAPAGSLEPSLPARSLEPGSPARPQRPGPTAHSGTVPVGKSGAPEVKSPKDSIVWIGDTLTIAEAAVVSNFGNPKKSPLRLTTISNDVLKQRAVAKSYPEMLRDIPGLYATAESGSFGDARVNIRGFKQENISILLNGIPISGQTSGNMYWNNWMGLADATYVIQVQKGPGTSMLSDNSVGGTINILTTPATEDFYMELGAYGTHWGSGKGYVSVNSGNLPKGWNIHFMASYLGGKGYVDQTDVSAFTYLLNVHKTFGLHHSLTFTALGSPEKHGQRSTKLSFADIQEKGLRYNKNWGQLDGKPYNLSRNNYFKPYFTLQHRFSKGKWSMQNSLYLAIAHGGGRWNEAKGGRMANVIGPDGQIDFEQILRENAAIVESGKTGAEGSAKYILSDFMAGHTQVGAIVSGAVQLSQAWRLELGTHYQHYATWEKERITDLLGGDYWWEATDKADGTDAAPARYEKKVGDAIRTKRTVSLSILKKEKNEKD